MSEQLFRLGFTNLNNENDVLSLEIQRHIPSWISVLCLETAQLNLLTIQAGIRTGSMSWQ
jgi:hypothetical protein